MRGLIYINVVYNSILYTFFFSKPEPLIFLFSDRYKAIAKKIKLKSSIFLFL